MSDFLLQLAQQPWYRRATKKLRVLPTIPALVRHQGLWPEQPMRSKSIAISPAGAKKGFAERLGRALSAAGAQVHLQPNSSTTHHGLLFDASSCQQPEHLRAVYDFFHSRLPSLAPNGRIILISRTGSHAVEPEGAATRAALEGFMRSLAKEVGRRGCTAHLLWAPAHAHDRLAPVVQFLLSEHAAFLTGQTWQIGDSVTRLKTQADTSQEKVAVVTGAARGIGAAISAALAANGARVICIDRPEDLDACRAIANEIRGEAWGYDLADELARAALVERLQQQSQGVDILVHNAGITRDKTLARMPRAMWDQVMAVNLQAVLSITNSLVSQGLNGSGRIVCLSSIAGLAGNPGQTNYAASKAGVAGYIQALAPTVASRGITANAVAPGFIETRMTRAIPPLQREFARRLSALGQGGLPSDVANLVAFLASPHADGLTGQTLRVCGGMLLGR